jgi:two-component system NarL family response regulator
VSLRVQNEKIRILVVDHNPLLREGLSALIQFQPDMEFVHAAASGREAVRAFAEHRPAVTIMDLDLPLAEGVKAIEDIIRIDQSA